MLISFVIVGHISWTLGVRLTGLCVEQITGRCKQIGGRNSRDVTVVLGLGRQTTDTEIELLSTRKWHFQPINSGAKFYLLFLNEKKNICLTRNKTRYSYRNINKIGKWIFRYKIKSVWGEIFRIWTPSNSGEFIYLYCIHLICWRLKSDYGNFQTRWKIILITGLRMN